MGLLGWLSMSSPKDLAAPIEAVSDLYTTDKARINAQTGLIAEVDKAIIAQTGVNAIMAQSTSFFVSGWQPMIGWTSGFLVLIYYAPQLIIINYLWAKACLLTGEIKPFPMSPTDILNLIYLLFGFATHSLLQPKR